MTKTQALAVWLFSLLVLAVTAGQSWQSFQVSADAGASTIEINGFIAFPVIGTLIVLQLVLLLVSLLVRPIVTRITVAAVTCLMVWNFLEVLSGSSQRTRQSFAGIFADQTGVITSTADSEFLVSSSGGGLPLLYLASVGLNVLILVYISVVPIRPHVRTKQNMEPAPPEDLWSKQS